MIAMLSDEACGQPVNVLSHFDSCLPKPLGACSKPQFKQDMDRVSNAGATFTLPGAITKEVVLCALVSLTLDGCMGSFGQH